MNEQLPRGTVPRATPVVCGCECHTSKWGMLHIVPCCEGGCPVCGVHFETGLTEHMCDVCGLTLPPQGPPLGPVLSGAPGSHATGLPGSA